MKKQPLRKKYKDSKALQRFDADIAAAAELPAEQLKALIAKLEAEREEVMKGFMEREARLTLLRGLLDIEMGVSTVEEMQAVASVSSAFYAGSPIPPPPKISVFKLAVTILAGRGKPMHVDELLTELAKRGKPASKPTVAAILGRALKTGQILRPGPSMWALPPKARRR